MAKHYNRVMLGRGGQFAEECHQKGYIGADFNVYEDLTSTLTDDVKKFIKQYASVFMTNEPGKTLNAARLGCGMLWTICHGLKIGDVVLKAKNPGDSGYNLPDSYRLGGKNYNGDLKDYSHIGVVTSVNPLVITHMTSPTAKKDTKIGNWKYYGQLPQVDYKDSSGGGGGMVEVSYKAKVIGGALNMRKAPSTSADRITQIPDGSIVDVTAEDNEWCAITYNGKSGYGMRKYLEEEKETGDSVTVYRAELEKIYDTIGDWLGFRG